MSRIYYLWASGEADNADERFPCYAVRLQSWGDVYHVEPTNTAFVFALDTVVTVETGLRRHELQPGDYGRFTGMANIKLERHTSDTGGVVFIAVRKNLNATTLVGGPIERYGRLAYIDGCTDSLLLAPDVKGDACLNYLHFPPGVTQTIHTHPSARIGIVVRGGGVCETDKGEMDLYPGVLFVMEPETRHGFRTNKEPMDVIAFHPDSDFGPERNNHPMINRTIVDGVSAKHLDTIRTK